MSQPGIDAATALGIKARRVVTAQILMTLVVAMVFFAVKVWFGEAASIGAGVREFLSAAFGGLSSVVLALISIRGFKRANQFALSDPKKSMTILYIGAAQRFVAVLVLLGIGLGLLKLAPVALFVGFALAQASYLMGAREHKQAHHPD